METLKMPNEVIEVSPEQIKENIDKLISIRDSISRSKEFAPDVADLNKTIASLEARLQKMPN